MNPISRRDFLATSSAAAAAAACGPLVFAATKHSAGAAQARAPHKKRVFVGSAGDDGILGFHWDPVSGELTPAGVAAKVPKVAWLALSPAGQFVFSASELSTFNGRPTGEVASFRLQMGDLVPVSQVNSAGVGTCHVALDHTGRMLVAADYVGGSAASFKVKMGALSDAVWTENYTEHGPNKERQPTAHAHFVSFSPDNRFAYINDLGGDSIHIYKPKILTAEMTPAGVYRGAPGSGPRTLHFHPNGQTAYCINELVSTVDVLRWNRADGSLTLEKRIELLPEGYTGPTRACDTVISRDGKFVYFANRDNNFLYTFKADPKSGELTAVGRSNCGGKTPRNFVLDPTERWMLVANQDSNLVSVFARDPETGKLADECKSYAAEQPMRILFT